MTSGSIGILPPWLYYTSVDSADADYYKVGTAFADYQQWSNSGNKLEVDNWLTTLIEIDCYDCFFFLHDHQFDSAPCYLVLDCSR